MKRSYRLRRPDQFRRARREGRSFSTALLTLYVVAGRRRKTRCGFVVGKHVGGAVERNRAKRRVREAVRLALPMIASGYDLVFVVRGSTVIEAAFPAIQTSVEQLLRRAGLWNVPAVPTTAMIQ
ncbi:MAG: ribonuclease P protein component [Oscillochloris sp.]|nr:ribonuclease P protein component [Oscillochloris sp.]